MTINTNELRRLAQAATPGGWYVARGNYVYGCKEVTDGEEVWHPVIACTDDDEVSINFEGNANFIAAANPAVINELLDHLEAAELDTALKEKIIDSLGSELNAVAKERDELRAKIEAMERQAPAMWANSSNIISARISTERGSAGDQHTCSETKTAYHDTPLYLATGAQGEEK